MEDDANTLRGVLEFDGKEVRDLIAHAVSCEPIPDHVRRADRNLR